MKTFISILFLGFMILSAAFAAAQEGPVPDNSTEPSTAFVDSAVPVQTNIFKLQFIRPDIAADKVRDLMGSSSGGVIVNALNELEISAPAKMMDKIKALIDNLDKIREISVDIKVVQVDLDEEHLPGINWSAIVSDYKSFVAKEENRKYSLGLVSSEDVPVLLEALETVGETKVYPINSAHVISSQDIDLRLKAFERDVSIKMSLVEAHSELSSEQQDRYTARLILSPVANGDDTVDLRVITSDGVAVTLNIKNDMVAVIGGIFTQTKSESTKKFPFLGDVPVLGIVFRDQSKVIQRLENILIVTPRVSTSQDK